MNAIPLFKNRNAEKNNNDNKAKQKFNPSLLASIQPQGGVSFKDKYIKKGDGYEACIHVYDYPSEVTEMWLEELMNNSGTIVSVDVATMDKEEAVTSINKSIVEQDTRHRSEKKASGQIDAENSIEELQSLYQSLSKMGEVIKLIHIRIFIHGKTLMELEQNISDIMVDLQTKGFKGQVLLNETSWEWESLFTNYEEQQKKPNKREGKGLPAIALAGGLPYHFTELNDPNGSYMGTSFTGGNIIFDLFHKDKLRRFFNAVIVGTMGAGKSTTLKKIAMDNIARGYFLRGFDVTGEFETLVEEANGQIISLDGSQGIINPLQIYKVSSDSNVDFFKNEELSYMQHFSKVTTIYQFLADNPPSEELEEYKKILREFYESLGFGEKLITTGVTTLQNDEYPIYSDLLAYVKDKLYEDVNKRIIRPELSVSRANRFEKIELVIDNLVHSYSRLFNGYTTLPDLTNEQVIFFSVKSLTKLEKKIFNAQMFNTLNLIWDNLITVGAPQLRALYEDETLDIDDILRFLVIIDESHKLINPENPLAVQFLTDFAREARKYFGGLLFASQSIRDYVPEGSNNEVVNKIKTLFELTQYKFIMHQDTNATASIRTIFEGQLNDSEINQIHQFGEGECLLINGVKNLMMNIEVSNEELQLFRGGM